MPKVLLLGYGDIAQRTAPLLINAGWTVVGACRNPSTKPVIEDVQLVSADANSEHDLRQLLEHEFDAIVITLTPSNYSRDGYHQGYVVPCRHLQHLLHQLSIQPRVLYVSSTGVYGQRNGELVDEASPTEPDSDSGEMLLQAERVILGSPADVSVLRCSGIYGPGRERMQQQLRDGTAVITPAWTNRIHSDDVAGFIAYLLTHPGHREEIYIVSDNEPLLQEEAYARIAHKIGVSIEQLKRTDKVGPRGSKRLSNSRMRATGYHLLHPHL
ncbi:Nucleoside-diphosphate-sugar epimerase [Pseudidiomarina maritima]|jgi:nucleoside-diphosphate-sugar epimerase|uniref:Nucleoside-diphosphate-sugar epimerase n=1 Tax=Pseudidiomarina maritima TaxID=519453 RepID=A0A1I6GPI3_9GAMM|nr:SDR family oxidoreductase [Pseudidiomarina maritima]SFR44094.1 Nucleoside-diphosphate-sugar epimerase [Pseudidiomarina maritima]